ncbi:hypothetical protein J6590_049428 [Homalodisca vitripennis]|nr:hypothetical protein J6590_049428 [Homalodisca vitripennis]
MITVQLRNTDCLENFPPQYVASEAAEEMLMAFFPINRSVYRGKCEYLQWSTERGHCCAGSRWKVKAGASSRVVDSCCMWNIVAKWAKCEHAFQMRLLMSAICGTRLRSKSRVHRSTVCD